MTDTRKVLVLGASGMLGQTVLRYFAASPGFEVAGTARTNGLLKHLPPELHGLIQDGVDVENPDALASAFERNRPDVVINCVGVVKQLAGAADPLLSIPLNSILPHRLARLCGIGGARLIHISTDCVFDGKKGGYVETDFADAYDLYGRSKFLGEVDYPHAITLRTSIIGHELNSSHGLVDWFLSQSGEVRGFDRAVFSGLPTVELARVIRDFVLPHPELRGVYHVSVAPINKYDLLTRVGRQYGRDTKINPDSKLVIDRSLNSDRFRMATGYEPPGWDDLIAAMKAFG